MVALGLLLAGCGGGNHRSSGSSEPTLRSATTTAPRTTSTSESGSTQPVLKSETARQATRAAVRTALLANHHLAIGVLWTNRIPPSAVKSTRGPALAGMRSSARDRQSKGVRVRMLRDRYRITSITLAPSLATATAVAESMQTVVPSHLNGHPLGRSVRLNERARIVLRRIRGSHEFVVWSITLLK